MESTVKNASPVYESITVITVDCSLWTGTKVMVEKDYSLGKDGKLPPKEVTHSIGSKYIIDPKELLRFRTIRDGTCNYLDSVGVRFLSGWAVPAESADSVIASLEQFRKNYEKEKALFLTAYSALVECWASQHPEFADRIRSAKKTEQEIDKAMHFSYACVSIGPRKQEEAAAFAASCSKSLSESLLDSLAADCRVLFRQSFSAKDCAGQRAVRAVESVRDRLAGVSFLSGTARPLVRLMDGILAGLPGKGKFGGESFFALMALVQAFSDKNTLHEILEGSLPIEGWIARFGGAPLVQCACQTQEAVPETPESAPSAEEELSTPETLGGSGFAGEESLFF